MTYCNPKGSRKKLSKNFSSHEWDCHCGRPECNQTYVSKDLVEKLQEKRDECGLPITIVSGYRCRSHNKSVGGAPRSQHIYGRAADIFIYGYTPRWVHDLCDDFKGLGLYEGLGFCHVDCRPGRVARWFGR